MAIHLGLLQPPPGRRLRHPLGLPQLLGLGRQWQSEEADLLVVDKALHSGAEEDVLGCKAPQSGQQGAAHGQPRLGMEADTRNIGKEDHRRDEENVRGYEPPQNGHKGAAHGPPH